MKLKKILQRDVDSKHVFVHRSTLVYENREGKHKYYDVVGRRPIAKPSDLDGYVSGVMAVITDPDNRVLITKEFRLAVNRNIYGLPSGMLNRHESYAQAAAREVFEECGIQDVNLLELTEPCYINPCMSNEKIVLMRGCINTLQNTVDSPNPNEEISSFWIPISELDAFLDLHQNQMSMIALLALRKLALENALHTKKTASSTTLT